MLSRLSSRQLTEWQAFHECDPFGEERDDLRAGIVASAVVNSQGGKTKPADFLPRWEEPAGQNFSDVMRAFIAAGAVIKQRE